MKKIFSLFLLYGGCESSEIQSVVVVTLLLVDVKKEEEYVLAKGTYGMGMDLKGDIKGALKKRTKKYTQQINELKTRSSRVFLCLECFTKYCII